MHYLLDIIGTSFYFLMLILFATPVVCFLELSHVNNPLNDGFMKMGLTKFVEAIDTSAFIEMF